MRILITGGQGFIGAEVVRAARAAGHVVRVARVDVEDRGAVWRCAARFRPDAIMHLAALVDVRESFERAAKYAAVNTAGSAHVFAAARRCGARVIFSSSGGALANPSNPLLTHEDDEPQPNSPYGATKLGAELLLQTMLPPDAWVILRYANVWHPKRGASVVAKMTRALHQGKQPEIFGDGSATRDFVHVADVAQANLQALKKGEGQIINIGSGRQTSVAQVFAWAAKKTYQPKIAPVFVPPNTDEVQRSALCVRRAQKVLGWRTYVDFFS